MKRIIPCIYLSKEKAFRNFKDGTVVSDDPVELAKSFCDNGADELIVFDLSIKEEDHTKALEILSEICEEIAIPVIAAGNIKDVQDVKKIFATGAQKAVLNFDKQNNIEITAEVSQTFGKEHICLSFTKPETLTFQRQLIDACISDTIWITGGKVKETAEYLNDPTIAVLDTCSLEGMFELFKNPAIVGISGNAINDNCKDLQSIKSVFKDNGLEFEAVDAKLKWSDFKLNSDGHVTVVVQDYQTNEVLMVAYMNEEAYIRTIKSGKMTYYSRSRNELWIKGDTSGHYQYVKSLTADCDYDTILAKVSQVGAACHTGSKTCFFNEIVLKDKDMKPRKSPLHDMKAVFEEMSEQDIHPEADFMYHMMKLMAQKGITWKDIVRETRKK